MARPFRFTPPTVSSDLVVRPRLQDVIATRWVRRLVTVSAGPGFGKTVLLATAVAADATSEGRRSVWLTCEPGDIDGDHLLRGILEAFGLSTSVGLSELCDAVWAFAPGDVCFVFDDVHELSPESDGAHLLGRLLTELPQNGHVIIATRDRAPVSTARLAAGGQLVRIGERDLVFDEREVAEFARARSVPPTCSSHRVAGPRSPS